jgi:hypothetical protein
MTRAHLFACFVVPLVAASAPWISEPTRFDFGLGLDLGHQADPLHLHEHGPNGSSTPIALDAGRERWRGRVRRTD